MERTTLMLPDDLRQQAQALAQERGISMGELIRQSLVREAAVAYRVEADAFWQAPATFRSGSGTLSERHDDELYGPVVQR
jgi:hypothetical protein